jgi:hypothetical protein
MKTRQLNKTSSFIAMATVLAAAALVSAHADSVDFEDHVGPSVFATAGPAQTLVYNFTGYSATFTGGVILTNEASQTTDFTSVYATGSPSLTGADPSLTNPLNVTFSQPIQNFEIDVLNAINGNYRMSDNVGDSIDFTLATTGGSLQTVGFAAAGTAVSIEYLGGGTFSGFDFAIDNVRFNQPLTGVPDGGSTIALLGLAVLGLFASRKFVRMTAAA